MNLFEIKEDALTFSPQALALEPFAKLWNRDKSKGKAVAIAELSAVYYYADYKSDFKDIIDPLEQLDLIKSFVIGMPKKWKPDDDFDNAVAFYKDRQKTVSTVLLEKAKSTVTKISDFLDYVDLMEVDDNGKLVHDVKKIADTMGNLPKVIETINKLEEAVKKDIDHKDSLRGGHTKSMMEDGA